MKTERQLYPRPRLTQSMRIKLLAAAGLLREEGSHFCSQDEDGNFDKTCPTYQSAMDFLEAADWIAKLANSGEGVK